MGGFVIKIDGLQPTLAKLDINKYKPQIQQSFDKFGIRVEAEAIQRAPVDEGHLKGAMYYQSADLGVVVGCSVDYAAYLEFGTRKFAAEYIASLPTSWQELAAKFKGGGGGSFEQFVLAITEWVHRKGLGSGFGGSIGVAGNYSVKSRRRVGNKTVQASQDKQIAYAIALKILREGIKPHPFLYPAVTNQTEQLLKDLKAVQPV